jgi:hypothetical protein
MREGRDHRSIIDGSEVNVELQLSITAWLLTVGNLP